MYRVLIADDSVLYRSQIRMAVESISGFEVVAVASNGRIACDLLGQSKIDLLILDLEMPEMDGLETLREMKRRGLSETRVLLFSSFSTSGAKNTMEALNLGADDFVAKPSGTGNGVAANANQTPTDKIRALVEPKLRALAGSRILTGGPSPVARKEKRDMDFILKPRVIVMGSSTGGPQVLEAVFSQLRGPLACPILLVQHMPKLFTAALAERLAKISGLPVQEAKTSSHLANEVYVAPGDYHMVLTGSASSPGIQINQDEPENYVRPAVDPLFRSAARIFGASCIGVVLTGMGSDGKFGAEAIRQAGGTIMIQDKETCAVFGMPGSIFAADEYDLMGPPSRLTEIIARKVAA